MRKSFKFSVFCATLLFLAGCVDLSPVKPGSSGGDALYGEMGRESKNPEEYEVDVMGDTQAKSTRLQKLINFVSTQYNQAKKVEIDLTTTSRWNEFVQVKKQKNQEHYSDGVLKSFYIDANTSNGEHSLNQKSFYDGSNYYLNVNSAEWVELNGDTKASTIYLYLIKLLLEGSDELVVEDGINAALLKREIKDSQLIDQVYQMIDIPFMITPKAKKTVHLEYQVNEENGEISVATIKLTINDLDNTYTIDTVAKVNANADFPNFSSDLIKETEALEISDKPFAEYFSQANPYQSYTYYEIYKNEIDGETVEGDLILGNYINQEPLMLVVGDIIDNELTNVGVRYGEQQYQLINQAVKQEKIDNFNAYAYFVERAIEHYDALQLVEGIEGEDTYTLREIYEYDYESFNAAVGPIDVSRLYKESEAAYGIDYMIDHKTQQLRSIYLWSTAVGEEAVSTLTILNFSNFNLNNPNFVTANVDEKIWQALLAE